MAKKMIEALKGRTSGALDGVKDAAAKVGEATASTAGAIAAKANEAGSAGKNIVTGTAGRLADAATTTAAAVAAKSAIAATGVQGGLRTAAERVVDTGTAVAKMTRERHEAKQAESAANIEAKRAEIEDRRAAKRTWRRVALLAALAAVLIGAAMLIEPMLRIVHTIVQRIG